MLVGWLAALVFTACASSTASTQGGSTDTLSPQAGGTAPPVAAEARTEGTPSLSSSTTEPFPQVEVSGVVTYRERVALSHEAYVRIDVGEVQQNGKLGRSLGTKLIPSPGQVPIKFSLGILSRDLRSNVKYGLTASIMDGTRVFGTEAPVPVLNQGHSSVNLEVVVKASQP
jgi:putative lipoprotein